MFFYKRTAKVQICLMYTMGCPKLLLTSHLCKVVILPSLLSEIACASFVSRKTVSGKVGGLRIPCRMFQ